MKLLRVLQEKELEHIGGRTSIRVDVRIIAATACNHKLYGPGGAAELLAINASTLKARMNKLGIGKKFMS